MDEYRFKFEYGESSFWYDCWNSKEPLFTKAMFADIYDTALSIKDVFVNESWRLDWLCTILPNDIIQLISQQ